MRNVIIDEDTGFCLDGQGIMYDLSSVEEKRDSTNRLEEFYENLQSALKPDICFEVGAGAGDHAIRLHRLLPDSQVIAFEGNPLIAERTHKKLTGADSTLQYMKRVIGKDNHSAVFVCRQNIDGSYSLDEAVDFDPADINKSKVAYDKKLRTYSINLWLNDISEKSFSLRINTHKIPYGILKGMGRKLFDAESLLLSIPTKQRRQDDWKPEELITFMVDGGFRPLARDFPESEKYFMMVFVQEKRADLPEVTEVRKKFLTRFSDPEPNRQKRKGRKKPKV